MLDLRLTAVRMESSVGWNVTPVRSDRAQNCSLPPAYIDFITDLLFDLGYGGGVFLRNIGLSLNCAADSTLNYVGFEVFTAVIMKSSIF
jgi:hypothetical protein